MWPRAMYLFHVDLDILQLHAMHGDGLAAVPQRRQRRLKQGREGRELDDTRKSVKRGGLNGSGANIGGSFDREDKV
jgi:hypothetical protein